MSSESLAALVWNGDNIEQVHEFMWPEKPRYMGKRFLNADEIVGVVTPSGLVVAKIGDAITKSPTGELGVRPSKRATAEGESK